MATSSAMKSSLLLLLLLSAMVASHAHEVSCKNTCNDPIILNGKLVLPGQLITLSLDDKLLAILVEVTGTEGRKHSGTYKCPTGVDALEFWYNRDIGYLVVEIIGILGGILNFLLGAIFRVVQCNLH